MDLLQFIFTATKDGAAWGLFAFSLVINLVLVYVCKRLFDVVQAQWKDLNTTNAATNIAISDAKNAVQNQNMLLQLLVGGKKT